MATRKGELRKSKKVKEGDDQFISNTEKGIEVVEKDETDFNKQVEKEREEEERSPIDRLIDSAVRLNVIDNRLADDQKFAYFMKGIKMHDILHDWMQSALNEYCKRYNAITPGDNLGLNLHLRPNKSNNKAIIGYDLVLELRRAGNYKIVFKKNISFTHVKDLRDEATWKYSLYSEAFNSFMTLANNHLLLHDDHNTGRITAAISR